jgi:hypothetical protein
MISKPDVRRCALPSSSRLCESLPGFDYLDSFEVDAATDSMRMIDIHAALLGHLPSAFKHLLVLRSLVVKPFGIRGVSYRELAEPVDTSRTYAIGDRVGRWTLYATAQNELITGADDRHLDFRVSVLRSGGVTSGRVFLSTAVRTHNTLGRTYLAAILPFHRFGITQLLARAIQNGRLSSAQADPVKSP